MKILELNINLTSCWVDVSVVDADNAFCWCDASHKVWGELTAYRTQLIVKSVCWVDTTGKDCQTGTIGEKVLTFVVLEVKLSSQLLHVGPSGVGEQMRQLGSSLLTCDSWIFVNKKDVYLLNLFFCM